MGELRDSRLYISFGGARGSHLCRRETACYKFPLPSLASLVQREVAQLCCDGGIVRSNAAQSSHRCAWPHGSFCRRRQNVPKRQTSAAAAVATLPPHLAGLPHWRGATPARLRLRSRGTTRRSMLTRAAVPLALRAKGKPLRTASF